MKFTIVIQEDDDFREEIRKMIRREIKSISDGEIHKMAEDHLGQLNVAQKVISSVKDLVNKQMDSLMQGYGNEALKRELSEKMDKWLEEKFEGRFEAKYKTFIFNHITGKIDTLKNIVDLLDKVRGNKF